MSFDTKTPKTTKITKAKDPTYEVIGCAIEVHRLLGTGLLESTYEECLSYGLTQRGIQFKKQANIPLNYKGIMLDCGYRLDLLVEALLMLPQDCY